MRKNRKIKFIVYFAFVYIFFCVFITCFVYLVIPDKTVDANTQIRERPLMGPLYEECFYVEQINFRKEPNIFQKLIFGNGSVEILKPIDVEQKGEQNKVCKLFLFGTDKFGRDLFSRVLVGIRNTVFVSFISVLISLFIGILLGLTSGYYGGKVDHIISIIISVFWSLPSILLAFAILFAFGRNMFSIFMAIALTIWSDSARIIRGLTMQYKEQQFVMACKGLGLSDFRIMFYHIFPNLWGPIWVCFSTNFALAVLLESGLSFLGLGLQAPKPSLGNILQEQYAYILTGKPIHAIIPAIIVILLILSFQIITNFLRDKTDVRIS